MVKVEFSECIINDENRIALKFAYNLDIIALIKTIDGRVWSNSGKFWHIQDSIEITNELSCFE